jgi:hypothetical protein
MFLANARRFFLVLIGLWNTLLVTSVLSVLVRPEQRQIVVHMGERSYPLYLIVMDTLAWVAAAFWVWVLLRHIRTRTRISLEWILLGLLLAYPLTNVYAAYSDLTGELCKETKGEKCVRYVSAPDLHAIKLTWEK